MKKVILGAVALMFATVGFAQVTDESGDVSPDVDLVLPIGGTALGGNTGMSIQNGDNNAVLVRQA